MKVLVGGGVGHVASTHCNEFWLHSWSVCPDIHRSSCPGGQAVGDRVGAFVGNSVVFGTHTRQAPPPRHVSGHSFTACPSRHTAYSVLGHASGVGAGGAAVGYAVGLGARFTGPADDRARWCKIAHGIIVEVLYRGRRTRIDGSTERMRGRRRSREVCSELQNYALGVCFHNQPNSN